MNEEVYVIAGSVEFCVESKILIEASPETVIGVLGESVVTFIPSIVATDFFEGLLGCGNTSRAMF